MSADSLIRRASAGGTVVALTGLMSPSTVPVLFHHFPSVEDARAAAEGGPDGVLLRVPFSFPLRAEQMVVLLFRAGQGWTFQATGRIEAIDAATQEATISFRGHEALVVEDAL